MFEMWCCHSVLLTSFSFFAMDSSHFGTIAGDQEGLLFLFFSAREGSVCVCVGGGEAVKESSPLYCVHQGKGCSALLSDMNVLDTPSFLVDNQHDETEEHQVL